MGARRLRERPRPQLGIRPRARSGEPRERLRDGGRALGGHDRALPRPRAGQVGRHGATAEPRGPEDGHRGGRLGERVAPQRRQRDVGREQQAGRAGVVARAEPDEARVLQGGGVVLVGADRAVVALAHEQQHEPVPERLRDAAQERPVRVAPERPERDGDDRPARLRVRIGRREGIGGRRHQERPVPGQPLLADELGRGREGQRRALGGPLVQALGPRAQSGADGGVGLRPLAAAVPQLARLARGGQDRPRQRVLQRVEQDHHARPPAPAEQRAHEPAGLACRQRVAQQVGQPPRPAVGEPGRVDRDDALGPAQVGDDVVSLELLQDAGQQEDGERRLVLVRRGRSADRPRHGREVDEDLGGDPAGQLRPGRQPQGDPGHATVAGRRPPSSATRGRGRRGRRCRRR